MEYVIVEFFHCHTMYEYIAEESFISTCMYSEYIQVQNFIVT
jgi:hypothetical protein